MIPLGNPQKAFSFIKRRGIVLLYGVNQSTGQVLLLDLSAVNAGGVSVLKCHEVFF